MAPCRELRPFRLAPRVEWRRALPSFAREQALAQTREANRRLAESLAENEVQQQLVTVLMDLRMPGTDGLAATRELAGTTRVLVLTTYDNDKDNDNDVVSAIEAGATGYLLKDAPRDELVRAVRAAARGEAVLAPAAAALLMKRGAHGGGRGAQPA